MQLTPELVRAIAPNAREDYADALVAGTQEFAEAHIITPVRMAMFLGQVCHETNDLTILREDTRWTPEQMCRLWPPRFNTVMGRRAIKACLAAAEKEGVPKEEALANLAYSDRMDIGNCGGDDGWAYRGASFLQGTGRAWFNEAGAAIGFPLEQEPWLIENAQVGLLAALWTWGGKGKPDGSLNRFADRGYIESIGCFINVGSPYVTRKPIGHEDRIARTMRIMNIMGLAMPSDDELALGARGDRVLRLQERLATLGYHLGKADGVFGPETARQVAAAKIDYRRSYGGLLEPEEVVGPLTLEAFEKRLGPIEVGPERSLAGLSHKEQVATLQQRGSTEVAAGRMAQKMGTGMVGLGGFELARQTGVLDAVTYAGNQVTALQLTLVPVMGALSWVAKNLFFVALICGGVWMWMSGFDIIKARIKAFMTRANLSK